MERWLDEFKKSLDEWSHWKNSGSKAVWEEFSSKMESKALASSMRSEMTCQKVGHFSVINHNENLH